MTITILFSDLHFGYEKFDVEEFNSFLSYLEKESSASRLLILGDMFDLWRADPINSLSYAWRYIDALRNLNINTHYIIGNHDYHNWVSCLALDKKEDFLWMKVSYPFDVFDDSLFVMHGDYFDIFKLRNLVPEQAIYGVYEAIYYAYEPVVRTLEKYFYDPITLLLKWIRLYHEKPDAAKVDPIAGYLRPFIDLESKQEIKKLEKGIKYLKTNPDVAIPLLVPSSSRPALSTEMPRLLKKPMTKRAKKSLSQLDTSGPSRSLLFDENPVQLAKEMAKNDNITKVIYGHTHKAENRASSGFWNTGCWVEGESTFAEINNGNVQLYRFRNGTKTEITEQG